MALTFKSVDEILWSDHSNETSLPVLLHATICFSKFYKMKFGNFFGILPLVTFGSERVKRFSFILCPTLLLITRFQPRSKNVG